MNFTVIDRHIFYTFPVCLYAGLIFFLSSLSRLPVYFPPDFGYDKLLHFIEYVIFGYLVFRLLVTSSNPALSCRAAFITILAGSAFAVLDEVHQHFVPGRDASLYDVLADVTGIAAAAFGYGIIRYKLFLVRNVEDRIEKGFFHGKEKSAGGNN